MIVGSRRGLSFVDRKDLLEVSSAFRFIVARCKTWGWQIYIDEYHCKIKVWATFPFTGFCYKHITFKVRSFFRPRKVSKVSGAHQILVPYGLELREANVWCSWMSLLGFRKCRLSNWSRPVWPTAIWNLASLPSGLVFQYACIFAGGTGTAEADETRWTSESSFNVELYLTNTLACLSDFM